PPAAPATPQTEDVSPLRTYPSGQTAPWAILEQNAGGAERAPGRSAATVASGASTSGLLGDRTRIYAVTSSSFTMPLIVSNPACQKLSDRMSTPKSFSRASGDRDPPAARSARYRGTNASP